MGWVMTFPISVGHKDAPDSALDLSLIQTVHAASADEADARLDGQTSGRPGGKDAPEPVDLRIPVKGRRPTRHSA